MLLKGEWRRYRGGHGLNIIKMYSIWKGLKKGLYVAGAVGVGIASMSAAVDVSGGWKELTGAVAVSAGMGGLTMAINWWKQNYKE
jgi:hypothetical protein